MPPFRSLLVCFLALATAVPALAGSERWPDLVRFPEGNLFAPLEAAPRTPRTHTTLQYYDTSSADFLAGVVGFGADYGLFRSAPETSSNGWQIGISGAIFALFNLDTTSKDLLNTDYLIGFPWTWRRGPWTGRVRLFHLSSHLGDELLLDPAPKIPFAPLDISFESLEVLVARDVGRVRLYGGGSRILRTGQPLGRDRLQAGVDGVGLPLAGGPARVVFGLDLQAWEETGWDLDLSVKLGLRLAGSPGTSRSFQITFEYYDGHVPFGQLFGLEVRYVGAGFTFFL